MYQKRNIIYFAYILLFLFALYNQALTQSNDNFEKNNLIVKFKINSEMLLRLKASDCALYFDEFTHILGLHSIQQLLKESTLKAYNKKLSHNNRLAALLPAENLSRIYLIEYNSPISPLLAANKLMQFSDIEYAEPLPVRRLFYIPSDTGIQYQYYLPVIKAFDAWDSVAADSTIIIGIVDTGVDYIHPDLADNIFINNGESGTDAQGNDRRTNGTDDDNNGFIDDWHGWDFTSSSSPAGQDNDPMPGHPHGTHLAGTAAAVTNNGFGVAGVAINAKILPVKIGDDNQFSTSVSNSFDGILYAASIGAQIINCSWGGETRSEAEQEIIAAAEGLGAVVVAAAGNSGDRIAFYPAAYKNVLSVAAVDYSDRKASFSNYDYSVDVSAPGVGIYATKPNDDYGTMTGTSMASPIASGVAALTRLKHPDYSPLQIIEQVKYTTDNIDSLNPGYKELIGKGRVNAFYAVTMEQGKSVVLNSFTVKDEDEDGDLEPDEKISIGIEIINVLKPISNAILRIIFEGTVNFEFSKNTETVGDMMSLETKSISDAAIFTVPSNVPVDYKLDLKVEYYDSAGYIGSDVITMYFNPSYKTISSNNITTTINSRGNIGFNDYPTNFQGVGFNYQNSRNLLYEGGLIVGTSYNNISDVVRSEYQDIADKSFYYDKLAVKFDSTELNATICETEFSDLNDSLDAGVKVLQKVYQFKDDDKKNFIILVYDVINTSGLFRDSVYAGFYFDWDIGTAGSNDQVRFDAENNFGYVENIGNYSLPFVGIQLLSGQFVNFYAIDNDGTTPDNIGVWDGFTPDEKWIMISNGISRSTSSATDASMVIGAGPATMRNGDTTRFTFSLFCGKNYKDLTTTANYAYIAAKRNKLEQSFASSTPSDDKIINIFPNPNSGSEVNIEFSVFSPQKTSLIIYDFLGNKIASIIENKKLNKGYYIKNFKLSNLSNGMYFIQLSTEVSNHILSFSITE